MYRLIAEKDGVEQKDFGNFVSLRECADKVHEVEFDLQQWKHDWVPVAISSQTDFQYELTMDSWWCRQTSCFTTSVHYAE